MLLGSPDEFFLRLRVRLQGLKVGEAAGVLFIVTGSDEHGLVELVVAKLLKGDGGCDRGENGDVCRENRKLAFTFTPVCLESALSASFLTQFDGKTRGELHLNKLPEFIKVLEGRDHLQNIQQPETKHVVTHEKLCTNMAASWRNDSRFDAQREVLTHGDCGFEVFLALFADQLPPEVRRSEETSSNLLEVPGSECKSGIYAKTIFFCDPAYVL